MKKYVLFIPILIISCQKETKTEISTHEDSIEIVEDSALSEVENADNRKDSVFIDLPHKKDKLELLREVEGHRIIRTIEATGQPMVIDEEFTGNEQELVLKIKNYKKTSLHGKISTTVENFNIRFNQIRLADGSFDGPFGREINHEIPSSGEIWLLIGKSNMASGEITGKFKVSID